MVNKKIAIIAPSTLPIPAVLSGGIEQLIENIINQNELTPKTQITVVSAYSSQTKHLEKKYKYTKFQNIKYTLYGRCFNYINRNIFSKIYQKEYFHHHIIQIINFLRSNDFDKVVILGNDQQIEPISKVVPKEKIIYNQATLMLAKANDFLLCDKILVGSNHSKMAILNHNELLPKSKVQVIQSGIDTEFFSNKKSSNNNSVRRIYNLDNKTPIICYLGRLVEGKGVVALLKAAISIKDAIPFKLLLVGSFGLNFGANNNSKTTEEEKIISNLISELGDRCIVTGFLNNDQLPNYLSSADFGIVPSIVEDVSPLTYFQFQAMGIPTIVSDAGGIPEFYSSDYSIMVNRGKNMENDLANAMIELIQNKEKRELMAKSSLENREHLGIKRYFDDFIKLVL